MGFLKVIVFKGLYLIVYIFSFVYTFSISRYLAKCFNVIYSMWLSRSFKETDALPSISYPFYLKGGKHIRLGRKVSFGMRNRIEAWDTYEGENFKPEIIIGNNVSFSHDCHIGAINKIIIGNDVLIGSKVYLSDHSHGRVNNNELNIPPVHRNLFSKGPVIIEDGVWIGEGASILPNVTIGKNTIIGANSVITKNVPANVVVVGNPGKIIKYFE